MIHFRISFAVCHSLSLSLKVQYTKTARIRRSEPVCANLLSLFVGWRGIGKILEYFYNYFLIFSSKWRPGIREYSGFVLTFYFKNIWIYVNIYIFEWICKYFVQFLVLNMLLFLHPMPLCEQQLRKMQIFCPDYLKCI